MPRLSDRLGIRVSAGLAAGRPGFGVGGYGGIRRVCLDFLAIRSVRTYLPVLGFSYLGPVRFSVCLLSLLHFSR